ncbi:MAG: acyltransferase family protein [Gemmatimonadaceae bacterium]
MAIEQTPDIQGHVPALDGVRGLAILVVMIGHFNLGYYPVYGFEQGLKTLIETGWWGVDLFFVLSGFLITGILLDAKGSSHYFRNFYVRRVLRIFPLYYGFLFAFFILAPALRPPTPGGPFDGWRASQGWYWSYLSNYQLLFPQWVRPYPLSHFWTLAIEEQFYLFWPAVVLLASRKGLLRVCLFCICGSLLFRTWLNWAGFNPGLGYRLTPARLDTLAIGAALAVIVRDKAMWVHVRSSVRYIIPGAIVALVILSIPTRGFAQSSIEMETVGYPLVALFSAALIIVAIDPEKRQTRLSRFFQTRPMRVLGKYSYALYVFHFPLAPTLERMGLTIQTFPTIAGSPLPGAIAFTIISGTISLAAAFLSWNLYEKHFLRLKRFFPRREARITNISVAAKIPGFDGASPLTARPSEPEKAL